MVRAVKPGRGGPRQGTPGQSYPQRTDMQQDRQPIRTVPAKTYGDATQQRRAQQAIPLPQAPPLTAPTQNPHEPVTAGMPQGAGPGPEAVQAPLGSGLSPADELRAMYQHFPTEELRKLIEYG